MSTGVIAILLSLQGAGQGVFDLASGRAPIPEAPYNRTLQRCPSSTPSAPAFDT